MTMMTMSKLEFIYDKFNVDRIIVKITVTFAITNMKNLT
jgi:hypothetical protein